MKTSPFKYGTTVSDYAFTNREEEVEKLYNNLTQGINTTIISPRRWGKSSLVEKVVKDLQKNNKRIKTLIIDLFSIAGEEEFLELFAREVIKASSSKWEDRLKTGKQFFKQLVPKFSIGIDPLTDFTLSFDWNELKKYKDEILDLPEQIARQKNIRLVVCLDEFQNIASYQGFETLEKKMRSIWQRHKNVSYCLYGSKKHMMTDIFNNPSKPFYRFGDLILLQKIKSEKWIPFIINGFKSVNKGIPAKHAELISQIMKQHPWYVQQLAHYTLQKTAKTVNIEVINEALTELIYANSPLYLKEAETISTTQLNLLKAISCKEKQLTSTRVMQTYKLGTPHNVSKNKTVLVNYDLIHEINGQYEILDPAFELWFKKQYFNQKFIVVK